MDFKKKLWDVINNKGEKTLDEEIAEQQNHEKFKIMRESCKRFNMLAWHFVLASIPEEGEASLDCIISAVEKNAIETWGDEAQKFLESLGVKTKQDITDMMNIALEHGVVRGSSEKCPSGELFRNFQQNSS
jgi:hypothetical protein